MHGRAQATGTGAPDPNRGCDASAGALPNCDAAYIRLAGHNVQRLVRTGRCREDSMTYPNTRGPAAPPTREALRRELRSGFRRALGPHRPRHRRARRRSDPDPQPQVRLGRCSSSPSLSLGAGAYYVMRDRPDERRAVDRRATRPCCRPSPSPSSSVGILWCGSIILTAVQSRPTRLDRGRTRAARRPSPRSWSSSSRRSSFKFAEYATHHAGHRRRRSSAATPVDARRRGARSPRARTRGPTRPASTSCCSAPTPAPTAPAPAPTR